MILLDCFMIQIAENLQLTVVNNKEIVSSHM